jgi:hypothetical protein
MAKAILEFNLPEETVEHRMAVHADNYHSVLWDIDQYLRSKLKYGGLTSEQYDVLDKTREELHDLMRTHNVTFEA